MASLPEGHKFSALTSKDRDALLLCLKTGIYPVHFGYRKFDDPQALRDFFWEFPEEERQKIADFIRGALLDDDYSERASLTGWLKEFLSTCCAGAVVFGMPASSVQEELRKRDKICSSVPADPYHMLGWLGAGAVAGGLLFAYRGQDSKHYGKPVEISPNYRALHPLALMSNKEYQEERPKIEERYKRLTSPK